jgi:hypothetical protein
LQKAGSDTGLFMSRMLQEFPVCFQRLPVAIGASMQHTCDMDEPIPEIICELRRAGLNDPRPLAARARLPLPKYVAEEVGKSFARVRLKMPPNHPPKIKASSLRQLGKLLLREPGLRDHLGVNEVLAKIYSETWPDAPEGSDMFKHCCAAEAFYLLETFTEKKPSNETIQTIAELLHGGDSANLERASKRVGKNRRKYPRNNPKPPPLGTPF